MQAVNWTKSLWKISSKLITGSLSFFNPCYIKTFIKVKLVQVKAKQNWQTKPKTVAILGCSLLAQLSSQWLHIKWEMKTILLKTIWKSLLVRNQHHLSMNFFQCRNSLVHTSKDRKSAVRSSYWIKVSVPYTYQNEMGPSGPFLDVQPSPNLGQFFSWRN